VEKRAVNRNVFREQMVDTDIVWAPDGDEAFDDGSHVLQFDLGERVRVIAFKNAESPVDMRRSLSEAWTTADEFYAILDSWRCSFEMERVERLKAIRL
jgi:hypothetical protein